MSPPMTVNIKLYDTSDNLVHSFESNKVINGNGFAQTYTITQSIYQNTGNFELVLSSSDAFPSSDSYVLDLRVNPVPPPVNNPPVITSTPITTVNESAAYSYDVNATDADGDTLTYSMTTGPAWLSINPSTGLLSGTAPSVTADTPFNIVIRVSDGNNGTATQPYVLTVLNVVSPPPTNNPPVITSTPITSVNESTAYSYDVDATDADNDTLTYSMTGPSWLSINSSTGLVSGTAPSVTVDTPFNVTITVSDGIDATSQSYVLTVINVVSPPVNNPPVITSTPVTSVNEIQTYNYQITATDADGDTLVYTAILPRWLSINSSGLVSGIAPSVTANTNYSITITVDDGNGGTASQSYILTVINVPVIEEKAKKGGAGTRIIPGNDFDEQQYLNQFAPITAAEEEPPAAEKPVSALKILLIIFWIIVFVLLIALAVLLVRRIRGK